MFTSQHGWFSWCVYPLSCDINNYKLSWTNDFVFSINALMSSFKAPGSQFKYSMFSTVVIYVGHDIKTNWIWKIWVCVFPVRGHVAWQSWQDNRWTLLHTHTHTLYSRHTHMSSFHSPLTHYIITLPVSVWCFTLCVRCHSGLTPICPPVCPSVMSVFRSLLVPVDVQCHFYVVIAAVLDQRCFTPRVASVLCFSVFRCQYLGDFFLNYLLYFYIWCI